MTDVERQTVHTDCVLRKQRWATIAIRPDASKDMSIDINQRRRIAVNIIRNLQQQQRTRIACVYRIARKY